MMKANVQKLFWGITILCIALLCSTSHSFANKEAPIESLEKKNILVLNSYSENFEWTHDIMLALKDRLAKSSLAVDLYIEYLDTKRFPDRTYWQHLFTTFLTKYQNTPIDLIVTSDNNALDFLFQYRDRFFPKIPVVFCGLNNFKPEMLKKQINVTGIAESTNLKATIDIALKLHPGTDHLVFVVSSARSSSLNLEQLEGLRLSLEKHLTIQVWKDHAIEENEKRAMQLKGNSLMFILGRSRNSEGDFLSTVQMGQRLSAASSVPIYSLWNFYLGTGIVGGKLINGIDQGRAAGELALKVLNGISVDKIPVITETPTSYMFDYLKLKQFKVSIDVLPENSIIINKPYSFYETNKKIAWSVFIVFVTLIALIIALSLNVLRRQRAEKELQKHRNQLENLVKERTDELSGANQALKENEDRYRSLSDASFEGIIFSEKGNILEINTTLANMFGYRPTELVGMKSIDLVAAELREDVQNRILSGDETPYETIGIAKDGTRIPVEICAKMFSYKERQVRVTSVRDLIEKKNAEKEIATLRSILPICSHCKKIRNDEGYYEQVDAYIHKFSGVDFSHTICPSCLKMHYPEEYGFMKEDGV